MEAEIFPDVFSGLQDADDLIRRNTAGLIKEIVKHTPEVRRPAGDRAVTGGSGAEWDWIDRIGGFCPSLAFPNWF